uniref:Uncharacterized protein n=1 Tax=Amphimedon queenslandica TaxID=400682 RepID=A0A1X7UXT2_AMPQE
IERNRNGSLRRQKAPGSEIQTPSPGKCKEKRVATFLSIHNRLLMRGSRVVIPKKLQRDVLDQLHLGHQ